KVEKWSGGRGPFGRRAPENEKRPTNSAAPRSSIPAPRAHLQVVGRSSRPRHCANSFRFSHLKLPYLAECRFGRKTTAKCTITLVEAQSGGLFHCFYRKYVTPEM